MFEGNKLICPVSGSSRFINLFKFKNFPIYMGVVDRNHKVELKNLCFKINKITGSVQIHPRVSLKKLYFKPHGSGTIGKIWHNHHINFFKFLLNKFKGKIVEIGGGHNSVSESISHLNVNNQYNLISFDPNGKKSFNKNHICIKNFFSRKLIKKNYREVNLVIHSHLFEHIYDPNKFLKDIYYSLSEGGYHIFSVPNLKLMIKKGFANAMNFEHPYFLEEEMIDFLLKKNGFQILEKKKYLNHSIFYKTKKIVKKNKLLKNKYNNFKKNKKIFINFYKRINQDVKKINNIIKNLEEVYLFGAHIFSQILISNGLDSSKIVGILDNDSKKHNKYLYGSNIKVYSPKILKKKKLPMVILRAAQYNQEIKKQIIQKINKKTKFI